MTGYVGPFGDSNYGDYAMFVNDVYSLDDKRITVFTYNGELLENLKDSYLKEYHMDVCKVSVNYQYQEVITGLYHTEYDTKPYTPFEILQRIENGKEIAEKMQLIDVLVVCGGGYFNHVWNANHRKSRLYAILGTILIAEQMHKKIVFMGNTYGPFDESAEMFSYFLNSLQNPTVAARDALYSISNLRKLGFMKDVHVVPDDLYFLSDQFQENKLNVVRHSKYIVLECYPSMDEIKSNVHVIRNFVCQMKERYHCSVIFLPLDGRYGGVLQGEYMKNEVPELEMIELSDSVLKVEDMNNIVKNAEFVICNRYHLFLTALTQNVPCVQVMKKVCGDFRYYYCKTKGLLNQVFANQMIDESYYIRSDIWGVLDEMPNEIYEIIQYQKLFYNDLKKQSEEEMLSKRKEFLKKIYVNN